MRVRRAQVPYHSAVFWSGLATVCHLPSTAFPAGRAEQGRTQCALPHPTVHLPLVGALRTPCTHVWRRWRELGHADRAAAGGRGGVEQPFSPPSAPHLTRLPSLCSTQGADFVTIRLAQLLEEEAGFTCETPPLAAP